MDNGDPQIRALMESRRLLAKKQEEVTDIKNMMCDNVRRKCPEHIAKRIQELKDSPSQADNDLAHYIWQLQIFNGGIWCNKCNRVKLIDVPGVYTTPVDVATQIYVEDRAEEEEEERQREQDAENEELTRMMGDDSSSGGATLSASTTAKSVKFSTECPGKPLIDNFCNTLSELNSHIKSLTESTVTLIQLHTEDLEAKAKIIQQAAQTDTPIDKSIHVPSQCPSKYQVQAVCESLTVFSDQFKIVINDTVNKLQQLTHDRFQHAECNVNGKSSNNNYSTNSSTNQKTCPVVANPRRGNSVDTESEDEVESRLMELFNAKFKMPSSEGLF